MVETWTVRLAEVADAPVLNVLRTAVMGDAWGTQAIIQFLSLPGAFGLIAEDKRAPVGCCLVTPSGDVAELAFIAVMQDRQNEGIGKAMLSMAEETARDRRFTALLLEVSIDNDAAIALYRRQGFVQTGLRENYYSTPAGQKDAVLMRVELL